jgi:hypothetical protein
VARAVYRIYLYVMFLVMLGLGAVSVGLLLGTWLLQTPLRGQDQSPPDHTTLVQQATFGLIGLAVGLGLSGLHYWLIRRNIADEPTAATGAVRALMLNLAQAITVPFALFAGVGVLGILATSGVAGIATTLTITLVALAVFVLLQLERGRAQPAPGAPIVLQRLHVYGVQTVFFLLAAGLTYLTFALYDTVQLVFVAQGAIPNPCDEFLAPGSPSCNLSGHVVGDWLAVAWVAAGWLLYAWLGHGDGRSALRQVAQYLGFAVGVGYAIVGVGLVATLVLQALLAGIPITAQHFVNEVNFVPPTAIGLVVMLGYGLMLVRHAPETAIGRSGTETGLMALAGALLAVPFYGSLIASIYGLVEYVAPGGQPPDRAMWASILAVLVAGLAHPLLAYLLRMRSAPGALIGPRRAFTLALLAAGGLAGAGGLVSALYLVVTAALGTPVTDNWQPAARIAGVFTLVGAFVAGLHLWRVLTERKLVEQPIPATPSAPGAPAMPTRPVEAAGSGATPGADSVESVVDGLLAGRLSREQAMAQLHALTGRPSQ